MDDPVTSGTNAEHATRAPRYPVHRYPVRVHYADTDAGGIAHHTAYLRFAEAARTEYLRDLGLSHARMLTEHHRAFVVRRVRIAYLAPAALDTALSVVTVVRGIRAASVALSQDVIDAAAGLVFVAMAVELGCIDAGTLRAARIPAAWATGLAAIVAAASEE